MRRVFVSADQYCEEKIEELTEMGKESPLELEFMGRHKVEDTDLLNPKYLDRQMKERIWACSVTLFVLAEEMPISDSVEKELTWSLEKNPSNGLLAVLINDKAKVPDRLKECGAEIIHWNPRLIPGAIERAARAAGRAADPPKAGADDEICARETA